MSKVLCVGRIDWFPTQGRRASLMAIIIRRPSLLGWFGQCLGDGKGETRQRIAPTSWGGTSCTSAGIACLGPLAVEWGLKTRCTTWMASSVGPEFCHPTIEAGSFVNRVTPER